VATHGEKPWPPAGRNDGRLRGAFHGHRQVDTERWRRHECGHRQVGVVLWRLHLAEHVGEQPGRTRSARARHSRASRPPFGARLGARPRYRRRSWLQPASCRTNPPWGGGVRWKTRGIRELEHTRVRRQGGCGVQLACGGARTAHPRSRPGRCRPARVRRGAHHTRSPVQAAAVQLARGVGRAPHPRSRPGHCCPARARRGAQSVPRPLCALRRLPVTYLPATRTYLPAARDLPLATRTYLPAARGASRVTPAVLPRPCAAARAEQAGDGA